MNQLKFFLFLGWMAVCPLAQAQSGALAPPPMVLENNYADFTPEQKEWLLATSALLTIANGRPSNDINEGLVGQLKVDDSKRILRGWKIYSKADLFGAIRQVRDRGHRTGFDFLARKIPGMSPEEIRELIEKDKFPELLDHRVRVVQKFSKTLNGKGIFCFDYVRLVSLAKWGFMAGYLTETEAWDIIGQTGILIQASVGSWVEMAHQYRVGRIYLELDPNGDIETKFDKAQDYLFNSPQSPWKRLPWNLSLQRKTVP